jgi:uracil-DNA glycosylase
MDNPKAFEKLIENRKACIKCHCSGDLCHFETKLLSMDGHRNLLGPWDPLEKNCLDAEILVIGQDFGIVEYLVKAENLEGLRIKEKANSTNKKLKEYLELAGLKDRKIYFTNAVLCIKNGITKKTKSGKSMSSDVKIEWFENCSTNFLKPLITNHLRNLKTIITLGKYALFSIKHIAETKIEMAQPFNRLIVKTKPILISNKPYTLIPMLHPSFDHLSIIGHEQFKKPFEPWEYLKSII